MKTVSAAAGCRRDIATQMVALVAALAQVMVRNADTEDDVKVCTDLESPKCAMALMPSSTRGSASEREYLADDDHSSIRSTCQGGQRCSKLVAASAAVREVVLV